MSKTIIQKIVLCPLGQYFLYVQPSRNLNCCKKGRLAKTENHGWSVTPSS